MDSKHVKEAYIATIETELFELPGAEIDGTAFSCVAILSNSALSPEAKEALSSALQRLGYKLASWTFVSGAQSSKELKEALYVLSPSAIILADDAISSQFQEAFQAVELPPLGEVGSCNGMRTLSLGNFEEALTNEEAKKEMWARLKKLPALRKYI